jgi:hypothetical protein
MSVLDERFAVAGRLITEAAEDGFQGEEGGVARAGRRRRWSSRWGCSRLKPSHTGNDLYAVVGGGRPLTPLEPNVQARRRALGLRR